MEHLTNLNNITLSTIQRLLEEKRPDYSLLLRLIEITYNNLLIQANTNETIQTQLKELTEKMKQLEVDIYSKLSLQRLGGM